MDSYSSGLILYNDMAFSGLLAINNTQTLGSLQLAGFILQYVLAV